MEKMTDTQRMTAVRKLTKVKRTMLVKGMMEMEWMSEVQWMMEVKRMMVMGQGAFQHLRTALACSQSMLHIHLVSASCSSFLQVDSAQAC